LIETKTIFSIFAGIMRTRFIENNRKSVLNNKRKVTGSYSNSQKSQLALCAGCTLGFD